MSRYEFGQQVPPKDPHPCQVFLFMTGSIAPSSRKGNQEGFHHSSSVTYTLDGLGNRTKEDTKDPAGQLARTLSRVFDGLARLRQLYGAQNQLSQFAYDQQGNLKSSTDPLSHTTADDYDALNRLVKVTQPLLDGQASAGTIGYAYDAQDNLTAVTDPLGHVTSYGYSGFNELKTLTSPDTGVMRIPVMPGRHSDSCRATVPAQAGPVEAGERHYRRGADFRQRLFGRAAGFCGAICLCLRIDSPLSASR